MGRGASILGEGERKREEDFIEVGDLVEILGLEDMFFLVVGKRGLVFGRSGIPYSREMETRHGVFDTQRLRRVGIGETVVGMVLKKLEGDIFHVLMGEDVVILDPSEAGHGGHYHLEPSYEIRRARDD